MATSLCVSLIGMALLVIATGIILHRTLSRRLRKLQAQLLKEAARVQKEGARELAGTKKKIEAALHATENLRRSTTEPLSAVAALLKQADDSGSRETPVLRQMLHVLGQTEMHAVVSFPKTGGSTVIATLAKLFPDTPPQGAAFHSHLLAPPGQSLASFFEGIMALTPQTPWSADDDFFPPAWDRKLAVGHAHRCLLHQRGCLPLRKEDLRQGVPRRSGAKPVINYVLCVRDPVAACVSMLFQYVSTWKRWEALSDDALLAYLRGGGGPPLIPSPPGCPWPLMQEAWWRQQIEQVFGIDFFALEFDREQGWQVYDFGEVRFLVVRLEDFQKLPQALGSFYDLPAPCITVVDANIGERKGRHGERYREFRARVRIPASVLEVAYSSVLARHFYTDAQLARFRMKWEEGSAPGPHPA